MSYFDRTAFGFATSSANGRPRTSTCEKFDDDSSPEEKIAWAMLELAIADTAILCRYGLITREGELRAWPMVQRWERFSLMEPMIIANMRDPHDHARLREFWLDPTQAQVWCDLCGCNLPAKDIWLGILKTHAK